jgi:bifunctional DNA-binding transcriptional regulator/antitoxin component of YhaV-PrlF toxin-antitoxin module
MREPVALSVDDQGRLVLPGSVQDRLRLEPGMTLIVEEGDNGGIRLRPEQPERPHLVDKEGILVVRAPSVSDLDDAMRRERDLRISSLSERAGL